MQPPGGQIFPLGGRSTRSSAHVRGKDGLFCKWHPSAERGMSGGLVHAPAQSLLRNLALSYDATTLKSRPGT